MERENCSPRETAVEPSALTFWAHWRRFLTIRRLETKKAGEIGASGLKGEARGFVMLED